MEAGRSLRVLPSADRFRGPGEPHPSGGSVHAFDRVVRTGSTRVQISLELVDQYKRRFGAESFDELYEISGRFTLDPAQITCPTRPLSDEGEDENQEVVGG